MKIHDTDLNLGCGVPIRLKVSVSISLSRRFTLHCLAFELILAVLLENANETFIKFAEDIDELNQKHFVSATSNW